MTFKYFNVKNGLTTGNITLHAGNGNVTANYFSGNASLSNLTVTGNTSFTGSNVSLGSVDNLKIFGGSADYVLKTDGTGNLSWGVPSGGGGGILAAYDSFTGNGVQTQYTLSVTPLNENQTFINIDGVFQLKDAYTLSGNIITFGSPPASGAVIDISSFLISNSTYSNVITNGSTSVDIATVNANITMSVAGTTNVAVVSTGGIDVSGNISAGYVLGNGYYLTGIQGLGDYSNTNVAAYLPTYTGNVAANYFIGNGYTLTNINGSNVTGQVGNALVAGTVYTNAQPNITSVGTLNSLNVSGNITAGNLVGDGGFLSNVLTLSLIDSSNTITNSVSNVRAIRFDSNSGFNLETLSTGNVKISLASTFKTWVIGNSDPNQPNLVASGEDIVQFVEGEGIDFVSNNTPAGANYKTLTISANLTNITGDIITSGNVSGNYILGNGALLTGLPATYSNTNVAAYLPTYTGNITAGNISTSSNITASYLFGNGSQLTGLPEQYSNANVANYLPTYTGNITAGNISTTSNITASYLFGNGSQLIGTIANANYAAYAGDVVNASQGNITSVGTLNGLTATGTLDFTSASNVSLGNVGNVRITGGTAGYYLKTDGTGNLSWDVAISQAGGANTEIQFNDNSVANGSPNFTFDKTTSALTLTGNITTGNANLGNIALANYFSGDGSLLSNITASNINGQVANALVAGTVYTNAQPNITSLGTLTSVNVSGNTTASQFISTVATGSAPFIVSSNTEVANLNANLLSGYTWSTNADANTIVARDSTGSANVSNLLINNSIRLSSNTSSNMVFSATSIAFSTFGNSNAIVLSGRTVTLSGNLTSGNANLGNAAVANFFIGNGSRLSSITGANVTGQVPNALVASTVYTNAQPNITSLGTLSTLDVTGNLAACSWITAQYIQAYDNGSGTNFLVGDDAWIGDINSDGNVRIQGFFDQTQGGIVFGNADTKALYRVGTGPLTYDGNIKANWFAGNGSTLSSLTGANVTGQVGNALVAGTVYTNAQPNITSLGTLSTLTVSANLTSGNLRVLGNTTLANLSMTGNFSGNFLPLGNRVWSLGSPTQRWRDLWLANTTIYLGDLELSATANDLIVSGNISSGNANLGNIAIANYFSGIFDTLSGNQPNITSLGTLSNLSIIGDANIGGNVNIGGVVFANGNISTLGSINSVDITASGNALITGNLTVAGNTVYANVETLVVEDPIIELGGGPNGAPLTTNDGKDRGTLLHYYTTAPVDAFMGWDNSNSEFGFGSNVTNTNEVITFNSYGNARANWFIGNLDGDALRAGTVTVNAQPNITSLGTLTSLSIAGNLTTGNASLGNLASANYISGNGSLLSSITGANVTGQVGNALVAGTVYSNAQPNITSVGTLVDLNVTGNVAANYFIGNGSQLNSLNGANITGQVANALIAGTVYTNAQPNITSVGTLSSLVVTSNVDAGNVRTNNILYANGAPWNFTGGSNTQVQFNDDGNLAGSANFTFDKTTNTLSVTNIIGNGAGITYITGSNVVGQVGNALVAGTVYTNAQPNITSLGTLSSLNVTANVTANYFVGNGSALSDITAANIIGTVANANYAAFANYAYNVDGSNVIGQVANANYAAYANYAYNVDGSNVIGQVANALVAGTVYTNSQPNITSVGTLSYLDVSGNISTAANVSATYFIGNGSFLTGLAATYSNTNVAAYLPTHTGNVAGNYFIGNGSQLTDITGANVAGQVGNALIAGTVYTNAQPNITSLGTLTSLSISGNVSSGGNVTATYFIGNGSQLTGLPEQYSNANVAAYLPTYTGNISANYYTGNGSQLTDINGSNITGQVANALVAGTVYTNAQPNITSLGTLSSLSVTANVTANYFIGNGSTLTNITAANIVGTVANANYAAYANYAYNVDGANVAGQVSNALVAGTVYTNAQPNITSVGTLTSLTVSGNISSGGNVTASYFIGNGSQLTGLPEQYSNTNVAAYLPTYTGNISANYYTGNGSQLTDLNGSNVTGQVANALIAGTVYTNSQPNITSVGTLTNLTVSGDANISSNLNVSADALITGNLTVQGNTTYINVETLSVEDPIIELGGGVNGAPLTTNDGKDRGTLLHYYNGAPIDAFMGWDNSNGEFAFGSNVTVSSDVVTFNTLGNIRANVYFGNGSELSALNFSNITTFSTAGLTTDELYLQGITRLNVTASGSSGYIFDQYGAANINPVIYVTSGQTLAFNLSVAGHPFLIQTGAGANYNTGLEHVDTTGTVSSDSSAQGKISGTLYWKIPYGITGNYKYQCSIHGGMNGNIVVSDANVSNLTVGSATTAGTVTTNAQPNITSLGTLSTLNVTANVTANYFIGNGSQLTDINGSNVTGQVANALIAGTVYTNAQPNITSVGTLTNLDVSGNLSSGGNVTASYFIGNGSQLTGLPEQYGNSNVANYLPTYTGNISANYYTGNGSQLTDINGSNVTGQVSNALVAGTVYTNAQPNITSLGTLSGLIVNGTANLGSVSNVKITGGTNGYVLQTDGAGNLSWTAQTGGGGGNGVPGGSNTQVQFNDAGVFGGVSGFTFDKGTNNLTISGSLISSGANLGNIANVYILGGVNNQFIKTDGTGNLSFANAFSTITVDTFTGNGVQTQFTLSTSPTSINQVQVNYNGVILLRDAYSVAGSVVTIDNPPANGSSLEITVTESINTGPAEFVSRSYTGDGANVNFTVTSGTTANSVLVSLDGVVQTPTTDYTITGTTLTFTTAPASSVAIQIRELAAATATNAPSAITVTGNAQPNITSTGTLSSLTVSGNVNLTGANVSLGSVANIFVSGGTSGQAIVTDGSGNLSFSTVASYSYSAISANTNLVAATRYIVDTSTTALTLTLPASATLGDEIGIIDGTGNASTNNITVARNGSNIQGAASDMTVSTDRAAFVLVYYNAAQGWILTQV